MSDSESDKGSDVTYRSVSPSVAVMMAMKEIDRLRAALRKIAAESDHQCCLKLIAREALEGKFQCEP